MVSCTCHWVRRCMLITVSAEKWLEQREIERPISVFETINTRKCVCVNVSVCSEVYRQEARSHVWAASVQHVWVYWLGSLQSQSEMCWYWVCESSLALFYVSVIKTGLFSSGWEPKPESSESSCVGILWEETKDPAVLHCCYLSVMNDCFLQQTAANPIDVREWNTNTEGAPPIRNILHCRHRPCTPSEMDCRKSQESYKPVS